MTDSPLVSIVTPSYQQVAYLEQTLQSVLTQDYPAMEYFVMDGGSTDGSVEIIRRYAPRLAGWVSEKDHGQAEAVNKGWARSRGEIIGWLNSDDLYAPGAVQRAVDAFAAHPEAALVFGDVRSIDAAGNTLNIMRFGHWSLTDLMRFNIISQPGVFIRRRALEQAGFLDLSYHFLLDHQLWLRVVQHGEMIYLPQEQASARFHAAAKNLAQAARFGQEAYRIVDWMQTQPALAAPFAAHRAAIEAGAHRMNARYLLDGGQPGAAFKAYARGLWRHPPTVLPELHRMVFCLLSLLGLNRLGDLYRRLKARRFAGKK
ncbi:MAG TPA: glycosyltransferase family 2 protein [Anaerolineaceae bacterium]|nr:glycosyltransferase family 2 protein [Anaerolineaceae bacterium]